MSFGHAYFLRLKKNQPMRDVICARTMCLNIGMSLYLDTLFISSPPSCFFFGWGEYQLVVGCDSVRRRGDNQVDPTWPLHSIDDRSLVCYE